MALQILVELKPRINVQNASEKLANVDGVARVWVDKSMPSTLIVDLEPGYDTPEQDADPQFISKGIVYRIVDLHIAEIHEIKPSSNPPRQYRTEIDHEHTDSPVCPQCGSEVGDAWEWCTDEMRGHEETCFDCQAVFRAFPHYSVSYSTTLVRKGDGSTPGE